MGVVVGQWTLLTFSVCCGSLFYPWFKFYFLLCLGKVMCDSEFEIKGNKI